MNDDQTLAQPADPQAPSVFGNPDGPTDPPPYVQMLTVEDVLAIAKRPELHARVCLRADLEAEFASVAAELATLVTAQGEVIEDPEAAAGDETNASRAQALNDRLTAIRREMAESMWFPLFRGKSSEDMAVFNKQHWPTKQDAQGNVDLTEYYTLLISECSVQPDMSVDQVRKLKATLGSAAYKELRDTAAKVCTEGGVNVPKSPLSLRNLAQQ